MLFLMEERRLFQQFSKWIYAITPPILAWLWLRESQDLLVNNVYAATKLQIMAQTDDGMVDVPLMSESKQQS